MYSFSGNCEASAPISTFMCLRAIYIFPGSVHIFPLAEKADPSREYIIRSQTHECWNWDWDPDIPFLGIFVSNFRHFVFAVHPTSVVVFLPPPSTSVAVFLRSSGIDSASPCSQSPNVKTFKEPKNRFQGTNSARLLVWRAGTTALFLLGS